MKDAFKGTVVRYNGATMILVLGSPEEAHAAHVLERIQRQGGEACYFDTRRFPGETRITFDENSPAGGFFQAGHGTKNIPLADIRSVYWRYHYGVETGHIPDAYIASMAYREIESALGSFCRVLDCLWVNPAAAIEMHRYKGYQLKLLKQAGLRVPETIVTNNGAHVQAFFDRLQGRVVFKPVRGGAHTQPVTQADLSPERLKELAKAPVQFQERIEGVDIRVYYVNGELFPAEIRSQTLDFRDDPDAPIVRTQLPEDVEAGCRTLAQTLGLVFSGIDIRRTPEGEYVFIEGNPSPMFIHFERMAGYPITDRLVRLLTEGRS